MNLTVRLWNPAELKAASDGSNLWLTTLLLNASTLTEKMAKAYPYHLRQNYSVQFENDDEGPMSFFAPNDDLAMRYLKEQYNFDKVVSIVSFTTSCLPVYRA